MSKTALELIEIMDEQIQAATKSLKESQSMAESLIMERNTYRDVLERISLINDPMSVGFNVNVENIRDAKKWAQDALDVYNE